MKIENFTQAFIENIHLEKPASGLFGRILRGKTLQDFESLSDDFHRPIVMVMGPQGLQSITGKTHMEALKIIGYTSDYITYRISQGYDFKLVVFEEGQQVLPATWDNIFLMTYEIFPDIKKKLHPLEEELKSKTFDEIQDMAGD